MSEETKGTEGPSPESQAAGYETEDANAHKIIGFTVLSVVLLAAMVIGLMEMFTVTREDEYYESVLKPESAPLRDLRAQEEQILTTYKLIDTTKQMYQIPIRRAMELMADEAFKAARDANVASQGRKAKP